MIHVTVVSNSKSFYAEYDGSICMGELIRNLCVNLAIDPDTVDGITQNVSVNILHEEKTKECENLMLAYENGCTASHDGELSFSNSTYVECGKHHQVHPKEDALLCTSSYAINKVYVKYEYDPEDSLADEYQRMLYEGVVLTINGSNKVQYSERGLQFKLERLDHEFDK